MATPTDDATPVFVYGTLTDPAVAGAVLDRVDYAGAATLAGCHRVEGDYPTLAPGGSVDGRLLRTDDLAALDAYEGVDRGLYVRVAVPLVGDGDREVDADDAAPLGDDDGHPPPDAGAADRTAAVYVGDPDALGAPAAWPGPGSFPERVRRFVSSERVVVRTNDGRQSPV